MKCSRNEGHFYCKTGKTMNATFLRYNSNLKQIKEILQQGYNKKVELFKK